MLKVLGIGFLIVVALLALVIVPPLVLVRRTPEAEWAKSFILRSYLLEERLGEIHTLGLPRRYRFEKGRASFTFPIAGVYARGVVDVTVEAVPGERRFQLAEGRFTGEDGRSFALGRRGR